MTPHNCCDSSAGQMIKKTEASDITLQLLKNPDIISLVSESKIAGYIIGFAAETNDLIQHAQEKQARKKIDLNLEKIVGP